MFLKRIAALGVPLIVSLAVVASAGFETSPIRDAATLADVSEAHVVRPLAYVAMAPLSNTLDMLTLLSVRQHVALFAGLVVLFVAYRISVARMRPRGWRSHAVASAIAFGILLILYAAA